jgi:hypothetical protein
MLLRVEAVPALKAVFVIPTVALRPAAAGQRTGVEIYHDHIAQPEFIDLKRLWKGEGAAPVLNLPFLIDHVMRSVHPLDWQAVLDSPVPLKVGLGRAEAVLF